MLTLQAGRYLAPQTGTTAIYIEPVTEYYINIGNKPTAMDNINKIKPAFRTKGRVTGNFGRNKVTGAHNNQIGVTKAEKINITKPQDYYERMLKALEITDDPKMVAFIKNEILKYETQHGIGQVRL